MLFVALVLPPKKASLGCSVSIILNVLRIVVGFDWLWLQCPTHIPIVRWHRNHIVWAVCVFGVCTRTLLAWFSQRGHPFHRQPWTLYRVGRWVIGSRGLNPSARWFATHTSPLFRTVRMWFLEECGSWCSHQVSHFRAWMDLWARVFTPEAIASGGNSDTLFNGFKVRVFHWLLAKLLTSGFEEFDVRFAAGLDSSSHDKVLIVIDLLLIPLFEFSFLFGRHAIWIVHFFGWHGSFIMLVFLRVEYTFSCVLNLWGKKPLHSSVVPKVAGELARGNGRKDFERESLKVSLSDLREGTLVPTVIWSVTSSCLA